MFFKMKPRRVVETTTNHISKEFLSFIANALFIFSDQIKM